MFLLRSFAVSSTFVWLCISSVTTCSRAPQPHRQASCNALRRVSLRCLHSSTADGVLGQATAYRSKWTQFVCLKPAAIQRWSASSCCDGSCKATTSPPLTFRHNAGSCSKAGGMATALCVHRSDGAIAHLRQALETIALDFCRLRLSFVT